MVQIPAVRTKVDRTVTQLHGRVTNGFTTGMAQRILREPAAIVTKTGKAGKEIDVPSTIQHLAKAVGNEEFLRTKYYKDFHKGQYDSKFFNAALKNKVEN
jgi:hypothetical protein